MDETIWSFSRLNAFHHCKHMYKLNYIDKLEKINNFFAQYGTYCHKVIEEYANNEMILFELSEHYKKQYNKHVTLKAPPNKYVNLAHNYYNQGLKYFENFKGFKDYKVVGIEQEFYFTLNGHNCKGYADLVCKDDYEGLIIVDHKSSDVKSASSDKAKEYLKQLYFYSLGVKKEYGKFPSELHINAFRKQKYYMYKFETDKLVETVDWVMETIKNIECCNDFTTNYNEYFCNFICSQRLNCSQREEIENKLPFEL